MAYEPFALKYRPSRFSDLVGQDPVATTLRNSLRAGRVANAFLFAGSRGVGKTSCARILAKALNCGSIAEGEPCGTCETCISIARGDDMDVIEIDGASNRGIDEIRAIRDNAGYKPSRGGFKIYIIDEVHMLTIQAFNALLKTLEEPPSHVKFIFATTEPRAVPETIVSRCQRFEFRRISPADIVARLSRICEEEGVTVEDGVLEDVAHKAEGGLRDSTSLLDQVVSFAGEHVTLEDLDRVLGRMDTELLEALLTSAGDGETGPLLDALDAAFESGRDAEDVLDQIIEVLREAMVREARGLEGGGEGRRSDLVAAVRQRFPIDRLLSVVRIALNARREIRLGGQGRLQLELALLKIARSRDLLPVREILARLDDEPPGETAARPPAGPPSGGSAPPGRPHQPAGRGRGPRAAKPPGTRTGTGRGAGDAEQGGPPSAEHVTAEWPRVLAVLKERSRQAGALAGGAWVVSVEGSRLELRLPAGQGFARTQLEGPLRGVVHDVVGTALGTPLEIVWSVEEGGEGRPARRSVYEDPGVRKVLDSFDGGLISVENEDAS